MARVSVKEAREKLRDPRLFAYTIFPDIMYDKSTSPLHREIFEWIANPTPRKVIIAPRGSGKTTLVSTIGTLYDIAYDREDFIALIKKTAEMARKDLGAIKEKVKFNTLFNEIFGPFRLEVDRVEEALITNLRTGHQTHIISLGTGQEIRGYVNRKNRRFTKIILDDFETEKNTWTPGLRERNKAYLHGAVFPSLEPNGKVLAIGTIVHYDSWLANRRKRAIEGSDVWDVTFYRATDTGDLSENAKSYWPERWPIERLREKLAEAEDSGRPDLFYQEYMNEPVTPDERQFTDFQEYSGELKGNKLYLEDGTNLEVWTYIGVDPGIAHGVRSTGYVKLLTADYGGRYFCFVHEAGLMELTGSEFVDWIFELYEETVANGEDLRGIAIEFAAAFQIYEDLINKEMQNRGIYLPIIPMKYRKESIGEIGLRRKEFRISSVLGKPVADGRIKFRSGLVDMAAELYYFPKPPHFHLLDALWLAYKAAEKPIIHRDQATRRPSIRRREPEVAPSWVWL